MYKKIVLLLVLAISSFIASPVIAQTPTTSTGPIYIVQPGDSLSSIAVRFNVNLNDLLSANNITDPNTLAAGQQLVIPGLEGVNGILDSVIIQYGETLSNIQRRTRAPLGLLQRLNRITSPSELYAGLSVIIPQPEEGELNNRVGVRTNESLFEAAIRANSDAWTMQTINQLKGTWSALPNDIFYAPGPGESGDSQTGLPSAFTSVQVNPLPIGQGRTAKIIIQSEPGTTLGGLLVDKPLVFSPLSDGKQVALQGVHAMLEPGPHPLRIEATLPNGEKQSFEQMILITSGYYPDDPLLLVEPETIDPATSETEIQQILSITAVRSPDRLWNGIFQYPAYRFPSGDCFTSRYGNRRTYLGSGTDQKYFSFHSGVDFCGGEGLPVYAPANGKVVFAGPLTIRGNATIIDHGWGIFSGFWHQSEISVNVGQTINAGETIGKVGGTGRVTGAHLHWEVWVNGVQVNPMEWLESAFP